MLDFDLDGVEIRRAMLTHEIMNLIKSDIDLNHEKLKTYGVRNLEKRFESIASLASSDTVRKIARSILGTEPGLVRALFFDKTPEKNWLVTWHQDRMVALSKKVNLPGWGPWSMKDGVHHVQPPVSVLDQMVTFRIHLDAADERNGCLKVVPRSHLSGILKQSEIDAMNKDDVAVHCVVGAGDAVIMRPHVLHASSKAITASHRRVVHLEYSSFQLPEDIEWA